MRSEPRSMTMVDVMALAAGVALALAVSFRSRPTFGGFPYAMPEPWVMLVISLAWLFWLGAASTSLVVAARLVRYRRFPRPAEWLAILIGLSGQQVMGRLQPIDMLTGSLPFGLMKPSDIFSSGRWTTAGLASTLVALGLGALRLLRNALPPWAKTAWLIVLAYLALAGPISAIRTEGPWILAPSVTYGPGSRSMLACFACELVATTPLALMLGLPAVAALIERARRVHWRWTEWAGAMASVLIALVLLPLFSGNFPFPSLGWVVAWLLGVGIFSWFVVRRFGPCWSRWVGDQAEEAGSTLVDASPASTLAT